jgi:hypothetical protein
MGDVPLTGGAIHPPLARNAFAKINSREISASRGRGSMHGFVTNPPPSGQSARSIQAHFRSALKPSDVGRARLRAVLLSSPGCVSD